MERTRSASDEPGVCGKCGHENLFHSVRCTRCGALLDLAGRASPAPRGSLDRVIGRGAFSTVYGVATARGALAVKVYGRSDRASRDHVVREVAALTRVEHARVARLVGAGHVGLSIYLTMPLYEGPTLRALLDGAAARRARIDLGAALAIARGLASALDAVHERGFVHRDVKPGNVIVTADGPVLIDFGFAERRARGPHRAEPSPCRVAGTLPYIAPEHLAGMRADREADLFSLGCVLYEMLSGRAPFGDEHVVRAILDGRPGPLPRDVPEEVADLTLALLHRDPAARPKSAGRWLRDLTDRVGRPRVASRGAPSGLPRSARTTHMGP